MDIYRAAKRRGKYPTLVTDSEIIYTTKINLDDFFTCRGCKPGRHFLLSCSEVDSTGYPEFDEPISARV